MPREFDEAWSDLNGHLRQLELDSGLTTALRTLEFHHRENGFIEDTLGGVQRYTFFHPDDPNRCFRVQYNPRRALRFAGSGRNHAPSLNRNNGCYLCHDNIRWQQNGAQLGYQIEIGERAYLALTNPFPLLPAHVVITSVEHRSQDWRLRREDGVDIAVLLDDLVRLGSRMPGYLGYYNGVDAGSSIPGHLHYHFAMRPDDGLAFPLEIAARNINARDGLPGFVEHYPLDVAVWKGDADDVVVRATDWIIRWGERYRASVAVLAANIIVTRDIDDDSVTLYFVPRDRTKSRADGFSGLVGGLEVLGEIVLSSPQDKVRLDNGEFDYFALEAMLASVHTPLEAD